MQAPVLCLPWTSLPPLSLLLTMKRRLVLPKHYAQRAALRGRLSRVGFDDLMFARLVAPPLTTVHQPMRGLGSAAAQLLLALLNSEPSEGLQVQLQTHLVVRGSCGCSLCPYPRRKEVVRQA